jgi:DNA helicase HerA-like ATPase
VGPARQRRRQEKRGCRSRSSAATTAIVPLERTAGKQIADLVVEHPGYYVLDFSHFESKEAERQLATDFAERFYRRKGQAKAPMHLFVDEADMFVPQRSPSGDQRMLGAFESIVRRGGIRGIGTTLISQRAAVVNKNVLEQIDVLIVLRTLGPNDQKAIKGYVKANGTPTRNGMR